MQLTVGLLILSCLDSEKRSSEATDTQAAAQDGGGDDGQGDGGDGDGSGDSATSNSPPTQPSVSADYDESEGLACQVEQWSFDLNGDEVSYTVTWTVDGQSYDGPTETAAATNSLAGSLVPVEQTVRGRTWACAVTPFDGQDEGEPGLAEITLDGPVAWQYAWEPVAAVTLPVDLRPLDDGTLLIATLDGRVVRLDPETGAVLGEEQLVNAEHQLIGIDLDPDFEEADSNWLYAWTANSCLLLRYQLDLETLLVGDSQTLLNLGCDMDGGASGGGLRWWTPPGEEPALFLGMGQWSDVPPAENRLLAMRLERGEPVPLEGAGDDYAYTVAAGLRNPWRVADCGSALCIADPGDGSYEEINLYTGIGQDFGWPDVEGPGDAWTEAPAVSWSHTDDATVEDDPHGTGTLAYYKAAVTGPRLSDRGYGGRLAGWAIYGEVYDGWLRALQIDDAGQPTGADIPLADLQYVMAIAEAPDGAVYAAELGGSVQRLIYRADRAVIAEAGSALSESAWAEAREGYEVRYPLWSNGADKDRSIALPEGTCIDASDPDSWVFPDGTHLWKTFYYNPAQPIETRVLEKRDGRWVGGVYVWDGEDAYLTDGTRQPAVSERGYEVPSEESCARCHQATRGREWPLGLDRWQFGEEGIDQVQDLLCADIGPIVEPTRDSGIGYQVRGWLHGNCANCHNPDGVASQISPIQIDWRYNATDTNSRDTLATYYSGVDPTDPTASGEAYIIVAGDADASRLIDLLEDLWMPPLGVWEPDEQSISQIREWINNLD